MAAQEILSADAADQHRSAVRSGADALEFFLGPADAAAAAAADLGSQMAITTMDAKEFKAAFDAINGALAASGSMVAYERAIDALSDSMKANGSFNAGIEAGRTNIENLNSVVSTAIQRSQALKETGDDLGALRVLKRAIGDLEEFGSKSEGAKRQAQPLIDELKNTRDDLRMDLNPKPALDALDQVGGALDDLNGKRSRPRVDPNTGQAMDELDATDRLLAELAGTTATPRVNADTGQAMSAMDKVERLLRSMDGDVATTYVRTVYQHIGKSTQAGGIDGDQSTPQAAGGPVRAVGGPVRDIPTHLQETAA